MKLFKDVGDSTGETQQLIHFDKRSVWSFFQEGISSRALEKGSR